MFFYSAKITVLFSGDGDRKIVSKSLLTSTMFQIDFLKTIGKFLEFCTISSWCEDVTGATLSFFQDAIKAFCRQRSAKRLRLSHTFTCIAAAQRCSSRTSVTHHWSMFFFFLLSYIARLWCVRMYWSPVTKKLCTSFTRHWPLRIFRARPPKDSPGFQERPRSARHCSNGA